MKLEMISLTVKDMDRAVEFYQEFLGEEPEKNTGRLSIFDLGNIRLSLWKASVDGVEVDFGENVVGTFKTDDLEAERVRLKELGVEVEEISDKGTYSLFHFTDTEGNLIEVYEGEK
jgi:catechol 2,3-dioxygenase-like lactoylglutathione lyase family enzyme